MFSATNHHSGVPFVVVLLSQLQEGSRGCLTARSTLLCAQGPLMPPPQQEWAALQRLGKH